MSMERIYGRLLAIYRYRARAGYRGWEILYGSIYWQTKPEGGLFSLLGGLLEVGREGEEFRFRLLYIPWW
jgi:hypothetical protein